MDRVEWKRHEGVWVQESDSKEWGGDQDRIVGCVWHVDNGGKQDVVVSNGVGVGNDLWCHLGLQRAVHPTACSSSL